MLQMDKCGLNTQTQIDALLDEASEHYSQKTINKLKDIDNLNGFLIGGASQNSKIFIDIIKKTFN